MELFPHLSDRLFQSFNKSQKAFPKTILHASNTPFNTKQNTFVLHFLQHQSNTISEKILGPGGGGADVSPATAASIVSSTGSGSGSIIAEDWEKTHSRTNKYGDDKSFKTQHLADLASFAQLLAW